jgi:hypothetical protein
VSLAFVRARGCIALIALALFVAPVFAGVIDIRQFVLEPAEGSYVVNADFDIDLSARLEEALNNGVPLSFVVEFELVRPRWYWFDDKTSSSRLDARLSYNPLLRQYRVTTAQLQRNFSVLTDAMAALSQVRGWPVLERERLGEANYVAALRMRLDTAQLPKPFQITALTDRDWTLASGWRRIPFNPAEGERR